jgi:hypothetical protein
VSLVSNFPILVIELSESMHLVIFPFTLIIPSVFEVESPMPVSLLVVLIALVATPLCNFFLHELELYVFILVE